MAKQRTNISVDADLLADVRALGLNVSAVVEKALIDARRDAWLRENAEAMEERKRLYDREDTVLAPYRAFKIEG